MVLYKLVYGLTAVYIHINASKAGGNEEYWNEITATPAKEPPLRHVLKDKGNGKVALIKPRKCLRVYNMHAFLAGSVTNFTQCSLYGAARVQEPNNVSITIEAANNNLIVSLYHAFGSATYHPKS